MPSPLGWELHSSRVSKQTFTQPQLVILYCLKIKLGVSYRDLIDWLREIPSSGKLDA